MFAANSFAAAVPDLFICAAAEAAACSQDEPCVKGSAESVALPLIWGVEISEKSILSIRENGEERLSPIHETLDTEDRVVLMGVDADS